MEGVIQSLNTEKNRIIKIEIERVTVALALALAFVAHQIEL